MKSLNIIYSNIIDWIKNLPIIPIGMNGVYSEVVLPPFEYRITKIEQACMPKTNNKYYRIYIQPTRLLNLSWDENTLKNDTGTGLKLIIILVIVTPKNLLRDKKATSSIGK